MIEFVCSMVASAVLFRLALKKPRLAQDLDADTRLLFLALNLGSDGIDPKHAKRI